MSSHGEIATHASHHTHTLHDDFLVRFRQNLLKETKWGLSVLSFVLYTIILTTLIGFIQWLFEFDEVKAFFGVLFPPFFIYYFGEYLTLIPTFFVIVLMMLPLRQSSGILMLAVVCSFFMVFLI
jgi:fatty acid desaturase